MNLVIGGELYLEQYRQASISSLTFIRDVEELSIVYCEDALKYETSTYSSWLYPLHQSVWIWWVTSILLILMFNYIQYAVISMQHKNNGMSLREELFLLVHKLLDILSTVLRQVKLRVILESKTLIVFSVLSLFLTIRYESVITSDIIAPPRPLVAKNLRELVVERGYKVFIPTDSIDETYDLDLHEIKDALAVRKTSIWLGTLVCIRFFTITDYANNILDNSTWFKIVIIFRINDIPCLILYLRIIG